MHNRSYKNKNVDIIDNEMLTHSSIKFIDMSLFRTQHSPMPDMGIRYFWFKNLIVDVCMHKTTYNINSGTPINFI